MDEAIFVATKMMTIDVAMFLVQLKGWLWMGLFFGRN